MYAGASFDFFLPNFSGYTVARFHEPFDANEVHVEYVVSADEIEGDPNHPAHYPANQLKNTLHFLANPKEYQDRYDLTCYEGRILKTTQYCFSAQVGDQHEGILFNVDVPPYGLGVVNPLMRTNYFSKQYGGIEVAWWTNVKNLPRWRDIDARIWKLLDTWNVASKP